MPIEMGKLTILVTPINAVGHVNACSGALTSLIRRGHRVIFVIEEAFKGTLSPLGYEEVVYTLAKPNNVVNPGEMLCKILLETKVIGDYTPLEKMAHMRDAFHGEHNYQEIRVADRAIQESIKKFTPDLIYFDGGLLFPSVYYSGIPWVRNVSSTPNVYIFNDEVPPCCSGLPIDGDKEKFREFNQLWQEFYISKKFSSFIKELGYEPYPEDIICPQTNSMLVYGYPDELNYPFVRNQKKWFNLEVFNKNERKQVVDLKKLVPAEFLSDSLDGRFSGKLIYVSLGSMGSVDLELMDRLLRTLAKTNHKYIVSKGPRHSEFELTARNQWGDRYLPQTELVPLVDLVITHGGNNTITETFAQGKPMIVLPLFADQFDNAQRLHETGLGLRVHPYKHTETELINAIDQLLYDTQLNRRLQIASDRIQNSNKHEELADRIEELTFNLSLLHSVKTSLLGRLVDEL